jgi:hypothetical protein
MPQGACCWCFCQLWLPISHIWMSATNRNISYSWYTAKDRWRSVDAHAKNGAVTVLLSLLPVKAANTTVMHNNDQVTGELPDIQDHKSLTLRWRSCLQWGGDHIVISFTNKSCHYDHYAFQRPSHWWITIFAWPQIVDAPFTLILIYCPLHIWCNP